MITVALDEKPGVQAIGNTALDLPPVPGKHPNDEYQRYGTLFILASLGLQDGRVIVRVEERHRSAEFITLLQELDAWYPTHCTIRIILDNHSTHISKETRTWLDRHPYRFKYVLTPTHGSWLRIAETLFGKMARTLQARRPETSANTGDAFSHVIPQNDGGALRLPMRPRARPRQHRRDPVWQDGTELSAPYPGPILDELKARILKGIEEINAAPGVHRWKNFEAIAEN